MDAVFLPRGIGQHRDRRDLAAGSGRRADQHDGQGLMRPHGGIEALLGHVRICREDADGLRRIQRRAASDPEDEFRPGFMGKPPSRLTGDERRVRLDLRVMCKRDPLRAQRVLRILQGAGPHRRTAARDNQAALPVTGQLLCIFGNAVFPRDQLRRHIKLHISLHLLIPHFRAHSVS